VILILIIPSISIIHSQLFSDKLELEIFVRKKDGKPLSDAIVYVRISSPPGKGESILIKKLRTNRGGATTIKIDKTKYLKEWREKIRGIKDNLGYLGKHLSYRIAIMIDAIKVEDNILYAADGYTIAIDPLDTRYEKRKIILIADYEQILNKTITYRSLAFNNKGEKNPKTSGIIYEEKLVASNEWDEIEIPLIGIEADENNLKDNTFDYDTLYGEVSVTISQDLYKIFYMGVAIFDYNVWTYKIAGDTAYISILDSMAPDFKTKYNSPPYFDKLYVYVKGYVVWEHYAGYIAGNPDPVREKDKLYIKFIRIYRNIAGAFDVLFSKKNILPSWLSEFSYVYKKVFQGTGYYNNEDYIDESPNKLIVLDFLHDNWIDYPLVPLGYILKSLGYNVPFPIKLGVSYREGSSTRVGIVVRVDADKDQIIKVYFCKSNVKYIVMGESYTLPLTFLYFDEIAPSSGGPFPIGS